MLSSTSFYVTDPVWISILSELGADISQYGIPFKIPNKKFSIPELFDYAKSLSDTRIKQLGADILSEAEQKLLLFLPRNVEELKKLMGYAADADTHTIETLVYNIRKKMGRDFIKLSNGEYKL